MNFNATFFIQIIHIIIGLIILERFFIKPWIRAMMDDRQQKNEHEDLLKQAQERVAIKEQFKHEQWREFQISFAQTIPHVDHEIQKPLSLEQKTLVRSHIKVDTQEVTRALVARLTHE